MQIRFLAGGAAILAAIGFLVVSSLKAGTTQNVPVHNLRAKDGESDSYVGRHLRIVGFVGQAKVKSVPLQTDAGVVSESHFQVVDGKSSVAITYTDVLPDSFRAGGPVQVDGTYTSPGVFKAEHVLTKCPSKYQEGEKSPAVKKLETGSKPQTDASGLKS